MNRRLKVTLIGLVIGLIIMTPAIILVLWLEGQFPDLAYLFWLWLGTMVRPSHDLSNNLASEWK